MLVQRAQYPPLLLGHVEVVQDRPKMRHQAVTRFQQTMGEIWVGDVVLQAILRFKSYSKGNA